MSPITPTTTGPPAPAGAGAGTAATTVAGATTAPAPAVQPATHIAATTIPSTASPSPPEYTVSASRPSEVAQLLRRMIGHTGVAAAADDDDDDDDAVTDAAAIASANPHQNYVAPPPYDENDYKLPLPQSQCKLPTYEEVEREKAARSALRALQDRNGGGGGGSNTLQIGATTVHCPPGMRVIAIHPNHGQAPNGLAASGGGGGGHNGGGAATITMTDATSAGGGPDTDPENLLVTDDALLGTDLMFVASFLVAFLFNWMGFLLITCACHNIAARYGSLSGFGLSLAKWTMIVKSSSNMITSEDNAWLWWLIMAFGLLICVRSAVQYVGIKRSWRRLTVASAERMLIYDN